MKMQWTLIFALLFALIIAVFSVVNVEAVPVDYVFGTAEFPLIMIILGAALGGGLVVGLVGTIRMVRLHRQIRSLQRQLQAFKDAETLTLQTQQAETEATGAETTAPNENDKGAHAYPTRNETAEPKETSEPKETNESSPSADQNKPSESESK